MSNLFTYYAPSDRTQSQVESGKMKAYFDRLDDNKRFKNIVNDASDLYVLSAAEHPEIRNCVLSHLAHWARAGAFLGNVSVQENDVGHRQAILIQAWWLTAYAIDFLKVDGLRGSGQAEDIAAIKSWFGQLADSIMHEFTPDAQRAAWLNRTANHSHWGAFAVGYAGVVLSDEKKIQFAIQELKRALAIVDANGALPNEMKRGGKSLHYLSFAVLPLSGLVALADANHIALDPAQEDALKRLVRFTMNQTRQPNIVEKLSGHKQEPILNAPHQAWVDIVIPHFAKRDPALADELNRFAAPFRPLKYEFLGGEVSRVFNLQIKSVSAEAHR
jgi:poly(beta-D-mannuronate) lyase